MTSSDANAVGPISRRGTLLGIAGATAGSIATAFLSNAFATQPPDLPPPTSDVSPFSVRIPHGQRVDLKRRLAATRLPERAGLGLVVQRRSSRTFAFSGAVLGRNATGGGGGQLLNSYPASA
jgi:hypothetical protein